MKERLPFNEKNADLDIKNEIRIPTVQRIFENAIKRIKYFTGLDLTISEQVKLKHIAKEVHDQLLQEASVGWAIDAPVAETSTRFLFENYGIDINPLDRFEFFGTDKKSREAVKEYFRQKQEEMFKP